MKKGEQLSNNVILLGWVSANPPGSSHKIALGR